MTELLEHHDEATTVSGRDLWLSVVAEFEDETPVTVHSGRIGAGVGARINSARGAYSYVYQVRHATIADTKEVVHALLSRADEPGASELVVLTMLADPHHYETGAPAEHPGTLALRDLQGWTNMPLDAIVNLAGLSPSLRSYWRQHPTSPVRPSQGGRLLRLHTAVGLIIGELGLDQARAVLHSEGWLAGQYEERRLVQLESRVRESLMPGGLQPPAYLAGSGLARDQLRARVIGNITDEHNRQSVERENHRLGVDDTTET